MLNVANMCVYIIIFSKYEVYLHTWNSINPVRSLIGTKVSVTWTYLSLWNHLEALTQLVLCWNECFSNKKSNKCHILKTEMCCNGVVFCWTMCVLGPKAWKFPLNTYYWWGELSWVCTAIFRVNQARFSGHMQQFHYIMRMELPDIYCITRNRSWIFAVSPDPK